MSLGWWQVERANEKKALLALEDTVKKQPALVWQSELHLAQYQRVIINGHFLKNEFLLDNQFYNHVLGYNVLTPFQTTNGQIILVDRGWIKSGGSRNQLPNIMTPTLPIQLVGSVYFPSNKSWVLGKNFESKGNITVVETIDTQLIGDLLHKTVYPYIIRLDKNESNGFTREWIVVNMPPSRHVAYALQWFLLAAVLVIIFLRLTINKKNENI